MSDCAPQHTLNYHSNVGAANPSNGDILTWDEEASLWVASPSGSSLVPHSISYHSDVTTSSPVVGDVLAWSGSQWVNTTVPGGPMELDSLTDVVLTTPSLGDAVIFNGTNWVNAPQSQGYRGAVCSTPGVGVGTYAVSWGSDEVATEPMHFPDTPTRLVVPSNSNYARIIYTYLTSSSNPVQSYARKNGTDLVPGSTKVSTSSDLTHSVSVSSTAFQVVPGDYLELIMDTAITGQASIELEILG